MPWTVVGARRSLRDMLGRDRWVLGHRTRGMDLLQATSECRPGPTDSAPPALVILSAPVLPWREGSGDSLHRRIPDSSRPKDTTTVAQNDGGLRARSAGHPRVAGAGLINSERTFVSRMIIGWASEAHGSLRGRGSEDRRPQNCGNAHGSHLPGCQEERHRLGGLTSGACEPLPPLSARAGPHERAGAPRFSRRASES